MMIHIHEHSLSGSTVQAHAAIAPTPAIWCTALTPCQATSRSRQLTSVNGAVGQGHARVLRDDP